MNFYRSLRARIVDYFDPAYDEQPPFKPWKLPEPRGVAGNTSTGTLKLLALIFMFCDHAGKMLLPGVPEMRLIGRLAFPLYCWCLVVGAASTHSFPQYLLRLAVVGLLSQPLYMAALNHGLSDLNIFFTLILGVMALWGLRQRWRGWHIITPVTALLLAAAAPVDYSWKGILLILSLWAVRDSKSGIAVVMVLMCLYWGSSSSNVSSLFGLSLRPLSELAFYPLISPLLKTQAFAIFALPLMLIKLPKIRLPRWVGYALYPAHLALLWVLEQVL